MCLCSRALLHALPRLVTKLIAKLAQPSLDEAVTNLFGRVCCHGAWDEAAFQAIEELDDRIEGGY